MLFSLLQTIIHVGRSSFLCFVVGEPLEFKFAFSYPQGIDSGRDETMPKAYEEGNGQGIGHECRLPTKFPQFLCILNLNCSDFWSFPSVPRCALERNGQQEVVRHFMGVFFIDFRTRLPRFMTLVE